MHNIIYLLDDKKINLCFLPAFLFSIALYAQSTQLSVRAFSEGFYRQSTGNMVAVLDPVNSPLVCDSGIIGLIDSTSRLTVFCSYTIIMTDGYGTCLIPSTLNGQKYLVYVKFKNTFHLLSAQTIVISGVPISIDLTIPQNACCNFDTTYGITKSYSGDLNFDGAIDGSDYLIMDADFQNNTQGYSLSDLNGDQIVDTLDFIILNKNLFDSRNDDYSGNCIPLINGLNEKDNFSMEVYPNPCKDYFTVKLDKTYNRIGLTVIDLLGKECINRMFEAESILRIDGNQMQNGIYTIVISADNRLLKYGMLLVANE